MRISLPVRNSFIPRVRRHWWLWCALASSIAVLVMYWRVPAGGDSPNPSAGLPGASQPPPSLQQAYRQFLRMPREQRQRLLEFDQALREEDAATQARYLRLMVRYTEWLERLNPEERSAIEQAASDAEKLARIREIKESQWIRTLPLADQQALAEARQRSEAEYRQLLERLRDRERQLDLEWDLAAPPAVEEGALRPVISRWLKQLKPHLSQDEWQLVTEIQKRERAAYLRLLAQLSEKYRIAIPPEIHRLRLAYPPVSQAQLWQFLREELDSQARAEFEKRFRDPSERDLALADLVRAYWQAHRQELERFREQELRRLRPKPKPAR